MYHNDMNYTGPILMIYLQDFQNEINRSFMKEIREVLNEWSDLPCPSNNAISHWPGLWSQHHPIQSP